MTSNDSNWHASLTNQRRAMVPTVHVVESSLEEHEQHASPLQFAQLQHGILQTARELAML